MKIKINGKKLLAKEGETILDVSKRNGIHIPTLCYHSDVTIKASCRVCVVEVNREELLPSCSTKVQNGMVVETDTSSVRRARKINLELLFSQHQEECHDCIWNLNCKMLDFAKEYKVKINKFKDRKDHYPAYRFGCSLEFDSSKCIDCRNCIEICKEQGVGFLEMRGKSHLREVFPSERKDKDCVHCGQCINHCPAGAFEAVGEFERTEKPLKKEEITLIFQIAPAVRAAIGEEFGLPAGFNLMGELVSSLRQLGGDNIFDVPVGADITTMEESKEFLKRTEEGGLPLLTSCCPSWVRFVEFYYPEFIPHLTTVRSPHIILGKLIKEYFSTKKGVDPQELFLISIMPCVAKKHEIEREELAENGVRPVDYVMTTRETGRLLKKNNIKLKGMEKGRTDDPFGEASFSGVSYGASGGVMQSAIFNIIGERVQFKKVSSGLAEASISYKGRNLRLAVVHGLKNARNALEGLKKDPKRYDYVEVMACPGGCIGGGGQPVPTSESMTKERRAGLRKASEDKEVLKAKDNPVVKKVYEEILTTEKEISRICHTRYHEASKTPLYKNKRNNK